MSTVRSLVFAVWFVAAPVLAQESAAVSPATAVPRVVQFSGVAADFANAPVEAKFSLYAAPTGGAPLWTETQTLTPDGRGRYSVLLGAETEGGLPQPVFSSGEARWLGIALGNAAEQPRTVLVATPYALKSADAETLAGHPASDFTLKSKPGALTDVTQISGSNGVLVNGAAGATGTGPTVALSLDGNYLATLGNNLYAQKTAVVSSLAGVNGVTVTHSGTAYTATLDGTYLGNLALSCCAVLAANNTLTGNNSFSGTNTFSKPITSTVATGTAPFTVASTTMVPNLNAAFLDNFASTAFAQTGGANHFTSSQFLASLGTATSGAGFDSVPLGFLGSTYNSSSAAPETTLFQWRSEPSQNNTNNPAATLNLLYGASTGAVQVAETGLSITSNGVLNFSNAQAFPGTVELSQDNLATGSLTIDSTSPTTALTAVAATGQNAGYFATDTNVSVVSFSGCCATSLSNFPYGVPAGVLGAAQAGVLGQSNAYQTSSSDVGWGVAGVLLNDSNVGLSTVGDVIGGSTNAGVWGDSVANTGQSTGVLATADGNTALMAVNNSTYPTMEVINYTSTANQTMFETSTPNITGSKRCTIDTSGNLYCTGTITPNIVLDGGKHAAMYSVASPENWFEDFGSGELVHGSGQVALEPRYSQAVNAGVEYHVFLTPKGDCKGLFVTNESANGFEVRELGGGKSSVAFDYRIVAKRKGFEDVRMADLTPQADAADQRNRDRAARVQAHEVAAAKVPARPKARVAPKPAH